MAMQVWDYNGKPYLITNGEDMPENCTNIRPPEGIWEPFYFDTERQVWIGSEPHRNDEDNTTGETTTVPPVKPSLPDPMMKVLAQSNMTIAKQANLIKDLEQQKEILNQLLATSYLETARIKNSKENDKESGV